MRFLRQSMIGLFLVATAMGLLVFAADRIGGALQKRMADAPAPAARCGRVRFWSGWIARMRWPRSSVPKAMCRMPRQRGAMPRVRWNWPLMNKQPPRNKQFCGPALFNVKAIWRTVAWVPRLRQKRPSLQRQARGRPCWHVAKS